MLHDPNSLFLTIIEGPSNRSFGLTFASVFLIIGMWPVLHGYTPRFWALCLCAFFIIVALILPVALTIPNKLWQRLGNVMHNLVNPIALGILFYAVFTPIGLVLRVVFRKKLLATDFDYLANTYWILREPPGPTPDSLKQQF